MPLAVLLALVLAPRDEPPVSTFASPSGAWTLTVTRRGGTWNGSVELVLAHDGVEAWSVEHELGLRDACVSDDGRVAGFGYTGEARDGYPSPSQLDYPRGEDLRVFVLDPAGALLTDESHRRGASAGPDLAPDPVAAGAFIVSELRRFVLRIRDEDLNRGAESWWAYDLDTGAPLSRTQPRLELRIEPPVSRIMDVRAIPGTPLVLVQWMRSQSGPLEVGSLFQLLDPELNQPRTAGR
jgi:hypothetical protein